MRDWKGIQDGSSEVGDGLTFVGNGSHYVAGELRRRPGMSGKMDLAGFVCSELRTPTGEQYIVHAGDNGTIKSVDPSAPSTVISHKSGLNGDLRGSMTRANDRLYYAKSFA